MTILLDHWIWLVVLPVAIACRIWGVTVDITFGTKRKEGDQ